MPLRSPLIILFLLLSGACPGYSFWNSFSTGSCSLEQKTLACAVLNYHNYGLIDLAKRHPSGVKDNAFAYNNIKDMCDGKKASRSRVDFEVKIIKDGGGYLLQNSYSCRECPTGTPGGSVCLTSNLLNYLITLAAQGRVIVNELAGACHSCKSRHYNGQAVDLHNDARTSQYLATCSYPSGT